MKCFETNEFQEIKRYRSQLIRMLLPVFAAIPIVFFFEEAGISTPLSGARVTDVKGEGVLYEANGISSQAEGWQITLRSIEEALRILPRNIAGSSFAEIRGVSIPEEGEEPELIDPTIYASSLSTQSVVYRFPCRVDLDRTGEALLAWSVSQESSPRGCVPPGIRVGGRGTLNVQLPDHPSTQEFEFASSAIYPKNAKSLLDDLIFEGERMLLESSGFDYCSVVDASGETGGFDYQFSNSFIHSDSTILQRCNDAVKECEEDSEDGRCFVVSFGRWSVKDVLDGQLSMSMDCVDGRSFSSGERISGGSRAFVIDRLLNELVREVSSQSSTLDSIACVRSFYIPGELTITPASEDEATLVQVRGLSNEAIAVDVISGTAIIKSAENPDGETVEQDRTYYERDAQFDPLNTFSDRLRTNVINDFESFGEQNSETGDPNLRAIYRGLILDARERNSSRLE